MEGSAFVEIGLPVILAIVMVGIGLTLTVEDFKAESKSRKELALAALGQCVLVPAVAMVLAILLDAPPEIAVGLVLVAATPGGATSNLTAYLARGNTALAIVMTVATSVVAIVTLPIWVSQALSFWSDELAQDAEGTYVTVPLSDVFSLLAFIIFVPIVIGMLIKNYKPDLAARLEKGVSAFSIVVMAGLIIGIMVDLGEQALPLLGSAGPAAFLTSTAAVGIGFLLGAVGRTDRRDTLAMACEFGIKNITLGMLIGLTVLESEEMALPSAIYGILMYLPVVGAVMIGRRWFAEPPAKKAPTIT